MSGPAGSPGGIAVLDARTRAPLAWRPLAELDLPTTLRLETLPEGPLLLVHAPSPEAAHDSGYTTIELPAARPLGQPRSASVDTTTATVTLVLEAAVGAHEAIVELRRLDRPRWRVTPVVPVPRGNRWTLPPLGPGRYRVTLRGLVTDTPPTLEFAVPGTTEVTIRTAAADAADPRHPDDRSPTTPGAGQPSSAGR